MVRDKTMINHNELCQAFADFMNRYPFTVFITLTNHSNVIRRQSIPSGYEMQVTRYLSEVEKKLNASIAAIGLNTLKYGGHLHSHFLLLKYSGGSFRPEELRMFERSWFRLADAQEITRQDTLSEYIASNKHMRECRTFDYYIFGDAVLKALN